MLISVIGISRNSRIGLTLVKSIQEVNGCVYTVLGTHWNTLYPDYIRNIHAVNGCGYTVPGTYLNALRHCFQLVPVIYMCPE